jgi:Hemopexin
MAKTTCLVMPSGIMYFFRGTEYMRHDANTGQTAAGYPKPIAGNWPGFAEAGFGDNIDAAVAWPNGKVYVFKGDSYLRYDIASNTTDPGYPRQISSAWEGVFDKDIDAVVVWPNGKAYFFRDTEYVRFDIAANRADEGYPRTIDGAWAGVFVNEIDSAMILPDGGAYFTSGDWFVRYDIGLDRADDGYPLPISSNFPDPFATAGGTPGGGTQQPAQTQTLRERAVALVTSVVPSDLGDGTFDDVAKDWTGGGTTCGFLCHWLLYKLGCTDTSLVNRNAPDAGLSYVDGKNISKLYHGGSAPFLVWSTKLGRYTPKPGDLVFIKADTNLTEHVFVFLSEEVGDDGNYWWNTAEAGQTNDAGKQCARLKRRQRLISGNTLKVSGNSPERNVIGWVDLDLLGL